MFRYVLFAAFLIAASAVVRIESRGSMSISDGIGSKFLKVRYQGEQCPRNCIACVIQGVACHSSCKVIAGCRGFLKWLFKYVIEFELKNVLFRGWFLTVYRIAFVNWFNKWCPIFDSNNVLESALSDGAGLMSDAPHCKYIIWSSSTSGVVEIMVGCITHETGILTIACCLNWIELRRI